MPRQAVIVLGMHRSGTSAFAGALAAAGLQLPGQPLPVQADNPLGFHEPASILPLDNRALGLCGTHWYGIEAVGDDCFAGPAADALVAELIAALRAEFPGSGTILLKDPRICRLMPLWRRVFAGAGLSARFVLPLRDPFDVARSLRTRNGFPLDFGLALWLRHVLDAERGSRGARRIFVRYADLLRQPAATVERIGTALLDARPPLTREQRGEIRRRIDASLNREAGRAKVEPQSSLQPWLAEAEAAHDALLHDAGNEDAARRLDLIRRKFDRACRDLAPMVTGMAAAIDALTGKTRAQEANAEGFSGTVLANLRRMFDQRR